MPRKKLKRFAELKELENVFFDREWRDFFGEGEVVLELACAAGQYCLALAERFPEKNFIGVDVKGERIWKGSKKAEGMKNVGFIAGRIEKLEDFFEKNEVGEIWITFPDPHPRPCKSKQRLTSGRFLPIYSRLMKKGGVVHLKTDSDDLFNFSVESFEKEGWQCEEIIRDVWKDGAEGILAVQTYYESKYLKEGRTIKYGRWRRPVLVQADDEEVEI